MSDTCSSLFHRDDFNDVSGCLKPNGHNDAHVCKNDKGEFIKWGDDYECDCGCWDNYEEDGEVCIVYHTVNSIND